jgi:hypothetical protein
MTLCGATTKQGGWACKLPPVPGGTRCRFHGGASPRAKAAAQRRLEHAKAQKAVDTYGLPLDIAPEDALLAEVHRTAGHVAWLGQLVSELEQRGLKQYATGEGGALWERPSVWVELYQKERSHLVAVCKAAVSAGVEQRRVDLAERQGELVGELLRVAIEAARLTPEQRERAYGAMRGHLALVRPA